MAERVPIFPLGSVLLPGETQALRVFELRYRRMVKHCLDLDTPFAFSLIERGPEVGGPAQPFPMGSMARIVDFELLTDGTWRILTRGTRRFRLEAMDPSGQFPAAWVTFPDTVGDVPEPEVHALMDLFSVYQDLLVEAGYGAGDAKPLPADPEILLWRVTSRMGIGQLDRQGILATDSLPQRYHLLAQHLEREIDLLRLLIEDNQGPKRS